MPFPEFLTSNKKRTGLILSIIVIFSGAIPLIIFTFFADPAHPYTITEITLETEDFTKIKAHIYTPKNMTGFHGGIVIGHGFTGNSRHMQMLAIELVKREFVVVSINFRGHGNSEGYLPSFADPNMINKLVLDMKAGIDYLEKLGNVNKIGLIGHSMGAMTALKTSDLYTEEINATVIIGMVGNSERGLRDFFGQNDSQSSSSYNLSRISNLLIANGRLEQMFTPEITLNFLKEYTNRSDVMLETLYGDFTAGNASKAVIGSGEHLFEPMDAHIIYESVAWFELAFYGGIRWDISLSAIYNQLFFAIALMGMIAFCFVIILYLHNYLWKDRIINPQKDVVKNASLVKLILYYILGAGIGATLLIPLGILFSEVLPVSMGQLLYAILVGTALGTLIMYYLLIRRTEGLGLHDIPQKIKSICSGTYGRSILYGILAALLLASGITLLANWSTVITLPTIREFGAIIGFAILFFPWLLIKEFFFRNIQSKLHFQNRFKEYFSMVGIGFLIDTILLWPLMLLTWGEGELLGFVALALTVVIIFSFIQQILVTWVYMYSGRNILGSTTFLCLFYAWMMINFYPFGLPLF
ncbi:MAG: alpha/beta hydrolase [Candidatus Helarchaeota archaeon]